MKTIITTIALILTATTSMAGGVSSSLRPPEICRKVPILNTNAFQYVNCEYIEAHDALTEQSAGAGTSGGSTGGSTGGGNHKDKSNASENNGKGGNDGKGGKDRDGSKNLDKGK
jgi:hypothetical protein